MTPNKANAADTKSRAADSQRYVVDVRDGNGDPLEAATRL